jgi:hypothetical protein
VFEGCCIVSSVVAPNPHINFLQEYQKAIDEFRELNPDWGKGIYATVSF